MSQSDLKISILLVDDEADLLEMISFDLERKGYQIVMAASGNQALKESQSCDFHLVISDYHMRNGSGLDLVRGLRAAEKLMPFILLTGSLDSADQSLSRDGVTQVVAKPFDRKQLLSVADTLIEKYLAELKVRVG